MAGIKGKDVISYHVMYSSETHLTDALCYCEPILEYEDPDTGNQVWVHRREN